MTNRLPYSTTAGLPSESDTFSQLAEYLRMAEEACYVLGHLRKANDDPTSGDGFLAVGQRLAKTRDLVTQLATGRLRVQ